MSKITQTRDAQALSEFGLAAAVNSIFATMEAGILSAATSASATANTSPNTHVANDCAGQIIIANTNATWGSGTVVYGLVLSNTSGTNPVFTVDKWYSLTSIGTTGTTPAATSNYVLLPCSPPFWYIVLSDSVSAVAGTETGAAVGGSELSTNGLGRAAVTTVTRTTGSTTATMAKTFTYTGSSAQNIGRTALVNSIVATTNFAYFVDQINSGTPAQVSSNGDTFTPTYSITVG